MTTELRLGEIVRVRHGGTPSKGNAEFWSGNIPWVSPKDFNNGGLLPTQDFISEDAIASSAACIVPAGTVLAVARSGILAHSFPIALTEQPLSFNQDIKALIPDMSAIAPRFLYHFLRAAAHDVVRRGVKKGATVHSLQAGFLEALRLRLPPLTEQRRIVDILDRAASIRRLRRQAQETARQIIPALFVKMFGDPESNQKGWISGSLSDVVTEFRYGTSQKSGSAGFPVLRIPNVIDGAVDVDDLKTVQLTPAEVGRLRLRRGDLLFVRTNGNPDYVGRCAAFEPDSVSSSGFSADAFVFASYLIRARLDLEKARPSFIQALLSSHSGRRSLRERARTSAGQYNVNTESLASLPIVIPPLLLQNEFEQRVVEIMRLTSRQAGAATASDAAVQAIQARLFG